MAVIVQHRIAHHHHAHAHKHVPDPLHVVAPVNDRLKNTRLAESDGHDEHELCSDAAPFVAPARKKSGKVEEDGVQLGIYTSWIRDELEQEATCMELPFTIVLLVAFSFMAMMHLRQDRVTIIEHAIKSDIIENANFAWAHNFGHKDIEDVNSFADFWSWTRLGLLPLLTSPWGYSEELDAAVSDQGFHAYDVGALNSHWQFTDHSKTVPARNDYLRFNKLIGGIRFGQDSSTKATMGKCTFPGDGTRYEGWFQKPCTPSDMAHVPPDLEDAAEIKNAKRVEWLITEIGDDVQAAVLRKIVDMEDGCASAAAQNRTCLCGWCSAQAPMQPWLNEMTNRVQITFVVFNPTFGIYSQAGINFWFNRAGHIYKLVKIRSAWCNVLARPIVDAILLILTDVVWFLLISYVVVNELREIANVIKKKPKPWYVSLAEDYLAFWNVVDWISIVLAMTIIYYLIALLISTSVANSALGDLAQTLTSDATPDVDSFALLAESFYKDVTTMLSDEDNFRFQLVIYPIIIMLRLFKSFDAQPSLAIITQTFMEASSDIFHFAIVFFSVYICMVVNAVLFFGQDSEAYATFERALHSCFMVIYGYWDYENLEEIGRQKAGVWFWMFQIIVVLILQNIMLAILMDAYSVVKGDPDDDSNKPISLPAQIAKQWRRFRQARRRERVRLNDIYGALNKEASELGTNEDAMLESESLVFPNELMTKVKHIPQDQAFRTLKDAQKDYDRKNTDPPGPDLLQASLYFMKHRSKYAAQCSAYLDTKLEGYSSSVQPFDEVSDKLGSVRESDERNRLRGAVLHAAKRLQEEVNAVRNHTQDRMTVLADDMVDVLAEEMGLLEQRQKEQTKTMEQAYASLKGVQTLAYKLSETSAEIELLVAAATEESLHAADVSMAISDEQVPEPPALVGVSWPKATSFAVECLEF